MQSTNNDTNGGKEGLEIEWRLKVFNWVFVSDKFKHGMTVSQTETKGKNKSLVFLENLTSGITFLQAFESWFSDQLI